MVVPILDENVGYIGICSGILRDDWEMWDGWRPRSRLKLELTAQDLSIDVLDVVFPLFSVLVSQPNVSIQTDSIR